MKMNRKLSSILALLLVTALLAGCSGNSASPASSDESKQESKTPTYAVITQALNSEYWHGFAQGAKDGAAEVGVNVTVNGPVDETKVAEQIAMIEDAITNNVDAILIAANQPKSMIPAFEKAREAGIPLMEVDVEDGWDGRVAYVGAGNYNGGVEAGKWFLANLPEGSDIAIIRGALGDPTHDLRANGLIDTVKGKLNIVSTQPADSLREKGVNVMENILTANPSVKGVFATNDEMALGALKAVQARKLDIKVIGFDGNMEALESVKSGGLAATVSCVGYDIAKLAVVTMFNTLSGKETHQPSDQVFVPPTAVDATLVDEYIAKGQELSEKIKSNN